MKIFAVIGLVVICLMIAVSMILPNLRHSFL